MNTYTLTLTDPQVCVLLDHVSNEARYWEESFDDKAEELAEMWNRVYWELRRQYEEDR